MKIGDEIKRRTLAAENWETTIEQVVEKLAERIEIHGQDAMVSTHEVLGIVIEEVRELEDAARGNDTAEFRAELWDVLIAALVGLTSID